MKKNENGVALLVVIFAVLLLTAIAMSVAESSIVEYQVSRQSVNRLRAYYAAKAGVKMGLLRVLLYKQAVHSLGEIDKKQVQTNKQYLDMIWKMPMTWPPAEPPELSTMQKDEIDSIKKESLMRSNFSLIIESEGSKIDINAIAHPIDSIAKATRDQVIKIFTNEVENNEDFSEEYSDTDFEELVLHMVDWIDENNDSLNAGDEKSFYTEITSDFVPPNEPFKTIEEIRMVSGMDDKLFSLLKDRITVYGINGVNVNTANAEVLQSIDEQIDKEIAAKIVKKINDASAADGGPFAELKEFTDWLENEGVNTEDNVFNTQKIPLFFAEEYNFRIESIGEYRNVVKEIEVVTYDFENIRKNLTEAFTEEENKNKSDTQNENPADQNNTNQQNTTDNTTNQTDKNTTDDKKPASKPPMGQPRVVYWNEF